MTILHVVKEEDALAKINEIIPAIIIQQRKKTKIFQILSIISRPSGSSVFYAQATISNMDEQTKKSVTPTERQIILCGATPIDCEVIPEKGQKHYRLCAGYHSNYRSKSQVLITINPFSSFTHLNYLCLCNQIQTFNPVPI